MNRTASIRELAQRLRRGALSAVELLEEFLRQINWQEPRLQAWVLVAAEEARAQADRCDAERRAGHDLGLLHGMPLGIKDLYDVRGWPTRAGSPLRAEHVADDDASLVARLREAGAVLLGKTVTTEWAWLDPPPTVNPWNPAHTPGGSSSGSAAAVAARMCVAALGTQTGGSIVRPASYCGICGLKPSFGRLETWGIVPVSLSLDHAGPMANSIDDLRVLFTALCGEPMSWYHLPRTAMGPDLAHVQLGWDPTYFTTEAEPEALAVLERAIARLTAAGVRMLPIRLPKSFAQVHAAHRRLMATQAAWAHAATFPAQRAQYGPHIAALLDEGARVSADEKSAAWELQAKFRKQMERALKGVAALVTLAAPGAAPARRDTTGDPRFNVPWSFSGLPSVTLPCGLVPAGLPVGLQLVGRFGRDGALLDLAEQVEQVLEFRDKTPEHQG